uniref:Uncharacterized protein n=1 Tax=Lygus hesperus TaxID=30085 RepID=A0A0A9Y3F8_LYGHE
MSQLSRHSRNDAHYFHGACKQRRSYSPDTLYSESQHRSHNRDSKGNDKQMRRQNSTSQSVGKDYSEQPSISHNSSSRRHCSSGSSSDTASNDVQQKHSRSSRSGGEGGSAVVHSDANQNLQPHPQHEEVGLQALTNKFTDGETLSKELQDQLTILHRIQRHLEQEEQR